MFGQVVIGPPGSGKSTYCHGMYQFLSAIGRKSTIINLDPANANLPYPSCSFDIRDFVSVEEIMESQNLGPNGGLMYALESLSENALDSIMKEWEEIGKNSYLLFDCPGQVELYTHHNAFFKIFKRLENKTDARLCVVSLVDSLYLTSPSLYVSVLLLSLRSMLQLDLPHINVISKIDKLQSYGKLAMRLDFYTEVQDLKYLGKFLQKESPSLLGKNYVRLSEMIAELIEDYNLVSFEVLAIDNKQTMINILQVIDKANGYLYGSTEIGGDLVWTQATRNGWSTSSDIIDIHERWVDNKQLYDKIECERDLRSVQEETLDH
ncbi:hypothetical protein METBIDRAFT_30292 [Metschnikowia bicuspidata var. bicuspidata NRRL YB-4993]|uniref:GPN-loop GTPase 2 n=1 Tax=Metschnikowia bicuspidata var. bicuspidata NRRL YB-4993 TaxID=869754 RepID=A0A1A0HID4_9ASCO|nr:hypothetical protein METBIDRAFT_30292 [Metschnikowia bicuspidata var. bicuspidata NRRL YB-4993]OBA23929.1 hypothetical protein METBIDRAFT_30292 [Metschnikowia bicuspidata var. bicuspidata NRRL YB-4993]